MIPIPRRNIEIRSGTLESIGQATLNTLTTTRTGLYPVGRYGCASSRTFEVESEAFVVQIFLN